MTTRTTAWRFGLASCPSSLRGGHPCRIRCCRRTPLFLPPWTGSAALGSGTMEMVKVGQVVHAAWPKAVLLERLSNQHSVPVMFRFRILRWLVLTFSVAFAQAQAQKTTSDLPNTPPSSSEQSMDDAWWTGPILAQSAATLPKGHFLIEPYFYDVISGGSHSVGSRAYVLYGLVDRFSVGVIPILGLNGLSSGSSSDVMGLGDVGVSAQFR